MLDEEDMSSAIYHEKYLNPKGLKKTVTIKTLLKTYGDFTAVNEVSFNLYSG